MSKFTIVTDGSCDVPVGYFEEHDIKVLPIPLTVDGEDFTGDYKAFYAAIRNGGTAKTSLINPETFTESFTEYAKAGQDVLYLVLSSGLSGTYQSSQIALTQVKDEYPDAKIFPIDSIAATGLHGLLVMLAVQKRAEGATVEETAAFIEEQKQKFFGVFTVDDLMYLHRGGRLSKLSAIGGSLLNIKPVLNIQPDGTLQLKNKVRGRLAALKTLVSQVERSLNDGTVIPDAIIPHTDCEEDANKLAELLKATGKVKNVHVVMMTPVIGAHVGPGAVAIVFPADITRAEYEEKFYK